MIRGSVSKGWLNQEGGFTFPREYYFDPAYRREQDRNIEEFLAGRFPDLPIFSMESNLVQPEYMPLDAFLVGGIQPNVLVGALLGAELVYNPKGDLDIDRKPLEGEPDPSDLPPVSKLIEHPIVKELDKQLSDFRMNRPPSPAIPPFFWDMSGRATIHGFITTSYKFIGEDIFLMLSEKPDYVRGYHRWITDVFSGLIDHFLLHSLLKPASIHVGECTGTMISAADYDTFVLPYLEEMIGKYGKLRLHSCGKSDHLIPEFKKLSFIHSLDTGSNTDIAKVREAIGSGLLIELAPPLELLLKDAKPEEAREWVSEILDQNRGGPMKIGYHFEPGYNLDAVLEIHEELIGRGLSERKRPEWGSRVKP